MTVKELIGKFGISPLSLPDGEKAVTGGFTGDLLSWTMSGAKSGNAWITVMSNINVIAVAVLTDASCVIIADNVTAPQDVIDAANKKGVNLLCSPVDEFSLSAMLFSELHKQ